MYRVILIIVIIIFIFVIAAIMLFLRKGKKFNIRGETLAMPGKGGKDDFIKVISEDLRKILTEYNNEGKTYPKFSLRIHNSRSFTSGKKIVNLCIWDSINKVNFNKNTIMQVLIHEVSHVICDQWDLDGEHGEEFHRINNDLNIIGERLKIFDPYQEIPKEYYDQCTKH
jgi:hypothetical protein